ncbi:MAG: isoprenylcysteine carboxylmethyltransferase family protein [Nitrospirota bacterium]
MIRTLKEPLAIVTIMFWSAIPVFWIPVHAAANFSKKLGPLAYLLSGAIWLPLAYLIYHQRSLILAYKMDVPPILYIPGLILFAAGMILHLWTIRLLGIGIIGIPEVFSRITNTLVTRGPFLVVRHPTYLAHTLIFSGVFLTTGVIAVGIITLLDLVTVNTVIIPLEEKELTTRFGEDYERYRKKVTSRFFPGF